MSNKIGIKFYAFVIVTFSLNNYNYDFDYFRKYYVIDYVIKVVIDYVIGAITHPCGNVYGHGNGYDHGNGYGHGNAHGHGNGRIVKKAMERPRYGNETVTVTY
jgi:hypothetical protein